SNNGQVVAKNLEKFSGLNHQEIAQKLIDKHYGWSLVDNLEKFSGLNHQEIAQRLIDKDQGDVVAKNLEKFSGLNHQEIAQKLIDKHYGWSLADNLEKFSGLNHQEIAQKLIKAKQSDALLKNADKFSNVDFNKIAHQLINLGNKEGKFYALANNLYKLSGLDKDIAMGIINYGYDYRVAENLQAFTPADHKAIISKLAKTKNVNTKKWLATDLKNSFGKIPQSNKAVARQLAKLGYIEILAEYPEKFPELDSDLQKQIDNYKATHPNK
ncbi:MAG TPA: hypothetical protein P5194_03170, partial [Patescibacteria group bacterium]|nr:hypothetical protein [Patescibacteria group bacterium]